MPLGGCHDTAATVKICEMRENGMISACKVHVHMAAMALQWPYAMSPE
jgi:hypothetical protein